MPPGRQLQNAGEIKQQENAHGN